MNAHSVGGLLLSRARMCRAAPRMLTRARLLQTADPAGPPIVSLNGTEVQGVTHKHSPCVADPKNAKKCPHGGTSATHYMHFVRLADLEPRASYTYTVRRAWVANLLRGGRALFCLWVRGFPHTGCAAPPSCASLRLLTTAAVRAWHGSGLTG